MNVDKDKSPDVVVKVIPESAKNSPTTASKSPGTAANSPVIVATRSGIEKKKPETANKSPVTVNKSPGTPGKSPKVVTSSPGTAAKSPGVVTSSPGAAGKSPGVVTSSPGTAGKSPEVVTSSPGTANNSPGATDKSPGTATRSTGAAGKSPLIVVTGSAIAVTSSGTTVNGSGATDTSPLITGTSPGTVNNSPRAAATTTVTVDDNTPQSVASNTSASKRLIKACKVVINPVFYVVLFLFGTYVIIGSVLMFVPDIARCMVAQAHMTEPLDYSNLAQFNLNGHAFFIDQGDTMVQAWYLAAATANPTRSLPKTNPFAPISEQNQTILIYCHGNRHSLSHSYHTTRLRRLTRSGLHVFIFDYRGYGRSAGIATGHTMINDAVRLWKFVRKRAGTNPILLYGHSLGGGICSQLAKRVQSFGHYVPGVLIEASFVSIIKSLSEQPIMNVFPSFVFNTVAADLDRIGLSLDSGSALANLPLATPIVVVHGEDDDTISATAATGISDAARANGRKVFFLMFDKCNHLEHHIFQDKMPHVEDILNGYRFFAEQCYNRTTGTQVVNCTMKG